MQARLGEAQIQSVNEYAYGCALAQGMRGVRVQAEIRGVPVRSNLAGSVLRTVWLLVAGLCVKVSCPMWKALTEPEPECFSISRAATRVPVLELERVVHATKGHRHKPAAKLTANGGRGGGAIKPLLSPCRVLCWLPGHHEVHATFCGVSRHRLAVCRVRGTSGSWHIPVCGA